MMRNVERWVVAYDKSEGTCRWLKACVFDSLDPDPSEPELCVSCKRACDYVVMCTSLFS